MSKEKDIKAAQKAVADKQDEAKRIDAELTELKLVCRNVIVAPEASAPVPDFED